MHVREALAAGVAGFLVPALASEVSKLSHRERIKIVESVLEEANNEVPVIAGAGEQDIKKCTSLLPSGQINAPLKI